MFEIKDDHAGSPSGILKGASPFYPGIGIHRFQLVGSDYGWSVMSFQIREESSSKKLERHALYYTELSLNAKSHAS